MVNPIATIAMHETGKTLLIRCGSSWDRSPTVQRGHVQQRSLITAHARWTGGTQSPA